MKQIIVKNPNNLPCIEHDKLTVLQGDLKTLSEENMGKLCHSIQKHGYFVPAFVWKSEGNHFILDATQRYHALSRMKEEGYEIPPIPYVEIEAEDKKDAAEKLLQITSRYGEINQNTSFLTDFDLKMDDIEIAIPELNIEGMKEKADIEEDTVPKTPEESISTLGDLWLFDKHRVLCGDCTKLEDVERLMNGKKADMVFTDPPYGVQYDGGATKREELAGDGDASLYSRFLPLVREHTKATTPFYICYADGDRATLSAILSAILSAKLEIRNNLIWNKQQAQFGAFSAQYKQKHEPIMYCFKRGETPCWYGPTNEVTVWNIDRAQCNDMHPTQKPIGLPARAIKNSSKENDIIADFFLGSGSTLIASHQLNRICYGMEIEPCYIDVILNRYAALTGEDPMREDGMLWSELTPQNDTK